MFLEFTKVSVARDTSYNLVAAAAPIVFTLAVTPFYLHAIGTDRFGVLAICWTIVATLRFASLGMGPALTYRLALMDETGPAERSTMAWTGVSLGIAASLVGALLVFAVGEFYFNYVFSPASSADTEIGQALPYLAAIFPLGIISGVLNGALQGRRRFGALSAIAVINAGLIAVAPLVTAYLISPRLPQLVLATIGANAVVVLVQFGICSGAVPLRLPVQPRLKDAKLLLGYGAWMSVTALIAPLVLVFDRFIIGALRGPAAVAVYVLPYNVVQGMIYVPASLSGAIVPRLAPALHEAEVQRLQSRSLDWLNGVLTPVSILAIAFAAPFFRLWIGSTLGAEAAPVAILLLVGGWIHGIGHIPSAVVVGRSRPDLLAKLLAAYLIPYLLLLYFATQRFGILGAAAAWTTRAAFDPILFLYTRPYASDIRRVVVSGLLVFLAMATALVLSWATLPYWLLLLLITGAACYQHRRILVSSAGELRRTWFALSGHAERDELLAGHIGI